MNRRDALAMLLAAGSATAARCSFAQQQGKVWRIGWISLSAPAPSPYRDAFDRRLRELGYVEGRNLIIERHYAVGDATRLPQMAADLVTRKVDLIYAQTNYIADVARRATRIIPIVIPAAGDPVGSGLAESLARPGGNVTGLSVMSPELAGKKLQLLREIVPEVRRVALLALANATEPGFATGARLLLNQFQQAGRQLGITILPQAVGVAADLPKAFATMRRDGAKALSVQANALTVEHAKLVAALAGQHRLPTIYDLKAAVDDGGLISYGPDFVELYRRSADFVDRLLKGANPADVAFEQPSKYEMAVNLKTARALGITFPQTLLLSTDHVIK